MCHKIRLNSLRNTLVTWLYKFRQIYLADTIYVYIVYLFLSVWNSIELHQKNNMTYLV